MPDDAPPPGSGGEVLGARGTARTPETRLYSDGVVIGDDRTPVTVPPHSRLRRVPGTALLAPGGELPGAATATPDLVARERAALAAVHVPGRYTTWADMAQTAAIDLRALLHPNGAMVAAASPYWRYVWPRDAAYGAVALCLLGLRDDALRVLRYVAGTQEDDGTWQARYLPDGSRRVPDGRGTRLDGIGWTLWATWVWWRSAPLRFRREGDAYYATAAEPPEDRAGLAPMVRAAARAIADVVDPDSGLPRPSPDYWERRTAEVTLGTAAPLLLGARTAEDLLRRMGHPEEAERCAATGERLREGIERHFAAHDYPRCAVRDAPAPEPVRGGGCDPAATLDGCGHRSGRDASVAFVLPPFAPRAPGPLAAWRRTFHALRLGNGGLRPGEDWPDTATAWTPQVALFAMTAACSGDRELAAELLAWLDTRRTRMGCLPEKVTADGRPAAVAPLALTAASVLIALHALDGARVPVPGEPD